MKILSLFDTVNRGGAEILALDVCRNAAAAGIDLTFVTTQGGELEADFRASGAAFFRLKRRLPVDLNVVRGLRRIIKERAIEIVHAQQAVDGLHLFLATRGLPIKQVLSFQGFVSDAKNRRTLEFLIPRVDANIYVSRGLQKWLKENDKLDVERNAHVIYNGTDAKRLQPTGKNLRREINLPDDARLFGMIGNFYRDPRKDQFTLCRALPAAFAAVKNAHCIFAGKIEPGAEAKFQECVDFCRQNGIAERVHFLGGRSDIADVLASLDLFVFSSLQEGLPLAVTEAMLAKIPLIVSDIEPLLEASDNGQYASIFPVRDAEILSEKIVGLMSDEPQRTALAARAFDFARENFTVEAHLKNLKQLYESL